MNYIIASVIVTAFLGGSAYVTNHTNSTPVSTEFKAHVQTESATHVESRTADSKVEGGLMLSL